MYTMERSQLYLIVRAIGFSETLKLILEIAKDIKQSKIHREERQV